MKKAASFCLFFIGTLFFCAVPQVGFSAPHDDGRQKSDEAVYLDGCLTLVQAVSTLMAEQGAPSSQTAYYYRKMTAMCRNRGTTVRAINKLNDDLLALTNNR